MDIKDLKIELEQLGIIKNNKLSNYYKKYITEEIKEEIIEATSFLYGENISLKERLYVIIKQINNQQKCIVCNKPLRMILTGPKRFQYPQTCGPSCFNKLSSVKRKREETYLKKYKVRNYFMSEDFKNRTKLTCLKKYSVEHPGLIPSRKDKWKRTIEQKYGSVDNFMKILREKRGKNGKKDS